MNSQLVGEYLVKGSKYKYFLDDFLITCGS